MDVLGLSVPRAEVDALFDSWDRDGSGKLDFNELRSARRAETCARTILRAYVGARMVVDP